MSDQAGIELVPYEAYEVSPGVWGIRCGDITVEIPDDRQWRKGRMREMARQLNAAAQRRYRPDSEQEWNQWWDVQYDLCRKVEDQVTERSEDRGDLFAAALCSSLIEHLAEMQRRYLRLPPRSRP